MGINMKEFKFVRGVYTKKPLFDNDTIEESLFILDKDGNEIKLNSIDDDATQIQLVGASDDNRECKLYAITSEQITISGSLVQSTEGNFYKFTPEVKANCVSDLTEEIPKSVREEAKTMLDCLENTCQSVLTKDDIGIGEYAPPVNISFFYNDGKSFTKNMMFKVEGSVSKTMLEDISGKYNDQGYISYNGGKVNPCNVEGVFNNGKKQKKAPSKVYSFAANTIEIDESDISADKFTKAVAHKYSIPEGYSFNNNVDAPITTINYVAGMTATIYRKYNDAFTQVSSFIMPESSGYVFDNDNIIDEMFIVECSDFVSVINDFPYGKDNIEVYNSDDYYACDGAAYTDDTGIQEVNAIYKKLTTTTEIVDVGINIIDVLDAVTLSPKYGPDYIITIDPSKIWVTATESQSY